MINPENYEKSIPLIKIIRDLERRIKFLEIQLIKNAGPLLGPFYAFKMKNPENEKPTLEKRIEALENALNSPTTIEITKPNGERLAVTLPIDGYWQKEFRKENDK